MTILFMRGEGILDHCRMEEIYSNWFDLEFEGGNKYIYNETKSFKEK